MSDQVRCSIMSPHEKITAKPFCRDHHSPNHSLHRSSGSAIMSDLCVQYESSLVNIDLYWGLYN